MKARIVILIGVAAIVALVLVARESTRAGPEQAGTPVASAERPQEPTSGPNPQASELPAREKSAIVDAPQEQSGNTAKAQEQTENVPAPGPPVPAAIFDQLVSPSNSAMPDPVVGMYRRFAKEQPDPSWSPNVEFQLQSYLQNEAARKLFDVVSMECRATICEIRAVAPSKELTGQSMEALQNRIFGMHKESWWTGYGLNVPAFSVAFAPDGRAVMIAYVATH